MQETMKAEDAVLVANVEWSLWWPGARNTEWQVALHVGRPAETNEQYRGEYTLWLVACTIEQDQQICSEREVPVPAGISPQSALFAPFLALALSVADRANLEIGAPVVVAGWNIPAFVFTQVARTCGALPIILVGTDLPSGESPAGQQVDTVVDVTNSVGAEAVLSQLLSTIETNCVAVDTTGDPTVLDLLLETLPTWSHLVLWSHASRKVLVDFHRNVHSKGLNIVGAPHVWKLFPSPDEHSGGWAAAYWQRAWHLLMGGWVETENAPVNWYEQMSDNPRSLYEVLPPTMPQEEERGQVVHWLPVH